MPTDALIWQFSHPQKQDRNRVIIPCSRLESRYSFEKPICCKHQQGILISRTHVDTKRKRVPYIPENRFDMLAVGLLVSALGGLSKAGE
jgi:hypothetical protein